MNHSSVKLGDFINLVDENFEDRGIKIRFYTVEGMSEVDYHGEIESFYSYILVPFYDYDIDSIDFQV